MLLHLTLELLRGDPPENRDATLGGNLASMLLKVGSAHYMCVSVSTQLRMLLNEPGLTWTCFHLVLCMSGTVHVDV